MVTRGHSWSFVVIRGHSWSLVVIRGHLYVVLVKIGHETKVGKCFLSLIDQHVPKTNPLHKFFNRNTLKLSYSCMSNVKTVISNHSKAELNNDLKSSDETKKLCNCRNTNSCPLDRNCNMTNIIYQAEVTLESKEISYRSLRHNFQRTVEKPHVLFQKRTAQKCN